MKDIIATNPDDALTLGIDIGGTNTVFGVVDSDGRILAKGSLPTAGDATFKDFVGRIHKTVEETLAKGGIPSEKVASIGVGAPCLNTETGVIEGAVDLPWPSPLPLTDTLTEFFGVPAGGDNDANAAALGEMYYGVARGLDNFIMLTLGTGVGSAIVCDGNLLHGARGLAGELGHTIIRRDPSARACACGRKGCLEMYATARGVVATAREVMETTDLPSALRDLAELDAKAIGEAAARGDEVALETFRRTGEILGEACADFTAFSSPKAIIFFGGVAKSYPHFEEAMLKAYEENLLWVYKGQVTFLRSTLPEADAALLGAAAVGRRLLSQNVEE